MTPTKAEIFAKASEMWHIDKAKQGDPSFSITPEESELRESGYLSVATSLLMRDASKASNEEWRNYDETLSNRETWPRETSNLNDSDSATFDVSLAMDTGFFIAGTSQTGKTTLAKHLARMLIDSGITVYVIDVSQAWAKQPTPINEIIEVRTELETYNWDASAIFDLSSLSAIDRIRFVNLFCSTVFDAHTHGHSRREFIIFEESQTYMPCGSFRLSTRRKNVMDGVIDIVTVGANYNVRFGLITQFPAMVDKAPVKITQQRYFGWTWEKNDTAYLKGFLGKRIDELPTLKTGEFLYQNRDKTERLHVPLFQNLTEGLLTRVHQRNIMKDTHGSTLEVVRT